MDDVMEWIEKILMELDGMKTFYDISYSKMVLNLEDLVVTTTTRTTELKKVAWLPLLWIATLFWTKFLYFRQPQSSPKCGKTSTFSGKLWKKPYKSIQISPIPILDQDWSQPNGPLFIWKTMT